MSATRKPGRNFLFVPGPTNIPDRVLRAMHIAMEDHRSSDFPKLTLPLYERLKTRQGLECLFGSLLVLYGLTEPSPAVWASITSWGAGEAPFVAGAGPANFGKGPGNISAICRPPSGSYRVRDRS